MRIHSSRSLTLLVGLLTAALAAPAVAVVMAAPAHAASSHVLVVRVGDGTTGLTSSATPVFLDEYAPDGTRVRSTALPTAAAGDNRPLTMSGSATSEGALALSSDGRFVTLAGYGAAPATASVASTPASSTPRPAGSGTRGLSGGLESDGTVTLVATTTTATNSIVRVADTAAFDAPIAATGTTIATAASNTVFRGIAFAPQAPAAVAPTITTQPQDATITVGSPATLSVVAGGSPPLSYQCYLGSAGDISRPITGATNPTFTTPPLTAMTPYFVRVSNSAGFVDSRTATVNPFFLPPPTRNPTIGPNPVEALALTLGDPDNPPALRTVDIADAESPRTP